MGIQIPKKDVQIGKHGQKTDRHGNRVEADGAKEGGAFVNATNSLPDLWAPGWNPSKGAVNLFNSDCTHPLLQGPPRQYMVLGALRLAMLIKIIHQRPPHAAINIVAHSQGCLITMLATCFLAKNDHRPPDAIILGFQAQNRRIYIFNNLHLMVADNEPLRKISLLKSESDCRQSINDIRIALHQTNQQCSLCIHTHATLLPEDPQHGDWVRLSITAVGEMAFEEGVKRMAGVLRHCHGPCSD